MSRVIPICVIILMSFFIFRCDISNKDTMFIRFVNVGQGDSIYITSGGESILVDGGPNYEILPKLFSVFELFNCSVNKILITHQHFDHTKGIERITQFCKFDVFYLNRFEKFKDPKSQFENTSLTPLFTGDVFNVGNVTFYVLWPPENMEEFKDINDSSTVLLMDYFTYEVLLTGDISADIFERLDIEKYKYLIDGKLDIYKVPHHGSYRSFDVAFLKKLNIESAVVSVGKNSYGHPSPLYEAFFSKNNINYYRTDVHGDITFKLNKGRN